MNKRHGYSNVPGYRAAFPNAYTGDWDVVVKTKDAGLDDDDGDPASKYATVCMTPGTIHTEGNLTNLLDRLSNGQFDGGHWNGRCDACICSSAGHQGLYEYNTRTGGQIQTHLGCDVCNTTLLPFTYKFRY